MESRFKTMLDSQIHQGGCLKSTMFSKQWCEGGVSQLGAEFVNLSQDCFLKSFQNKTIEPAIFLLSKSQTRPPIKILIYFAITHSIIYHLKPPFLFIISINPIIPEKGTPAVATNLEKKKKNQMSVSSIH